MTFWKISDTRMNCLIPLAEIETMGYSLEELMQKREKTQEFLNLILEKGKEVLDMPFENGIQSFYGALLPDKSLLLSISGDGPETGAGKAMSGQNQVISTESGRVVSNTDSAEGPILTYQLIFPTLDNVIRFCTVFGSEKASGSRLYEDDALYYLMVDFPNTQEGMKCALATVSASEFGGLVEKDSISESFLQEHEEMLIADHAVEKLREFEMDTSVKTE